MQRLAVRGESVDADALEKDSEFVRDIADASGVSQADLQEEFLELRNEMRDGFASIFAKPDEMKLLIRGLKQDMIRGLKQDEMKTIKEQLLFFWNCCCCCCSRSSATALSDARVLLVGEELRRCIFAVPVRLETSSHYVG